MVPMHDGVKLYTVIWTPKGAHDAPIVLTRTPYNGAAHMRSSSPRMIEALSLGDEGFVRSGFIRVYQDVRGKYGSEGPYLMTPPPVGAFNSDGRGRHDGCVRHDRMAGEERAGRATAV